MSGSLFKMEKKASKSYKTYTPSGGLNIAQPERGPCHNLQTAVQPRLRFARPSLTLARFEGVLAAVIMSGYDLGITVLRGVYGIQLGLGTDDR